MKWRFLHAAERIALLIGLCVCACGPRNGRGGSTQRTVQCPPSASVPTAPSASPVSTVPPEKVVSTVLLAESERSILSGLAVNTRYVFAVTRREQRYLTPWELWAIPKTRGFARPRALLRCPTGPAAVAADDEAVYLGCPGRSRTPDFQPLMPREPDGRLEVMRMDGAGRFTRFTYFPRLTSANWIGFDGLFVYFASSSSRTLSRIPRFDVGRTSPPAPERLRGLVNSAGWAVGSEGLYSIKPGGGAVLRWRDGRQTDVWEIEGAKLLLGVNARGDALLSFEHGIKALDPSTGQLSDVVDGLDGVEGAGFSASGALLVRTRRAIWQLWDLPIRAPLLLPWVELPRQIFDWVIDRNHVYVVVSSNEDIGQASHGGPGWGLYDLVIPPRD